MTDNTYTKSEIRKMEVLMCKTLEFGFGKPLPLHFLRRYSKAAQADPRQHTLAKYFMELALHDADFSSMDPSLLAAASLHLSLQLLNGPKWVKLTLLLLIVHGFSSIRLSFISFWSIHVL